MPCSRRTWRPRGDGSRRSKRSPWRPLVRVSAESPVSNPHERPSVALRLERPLHGVRIVGAVPFDENPLVAFDRLHVNRRPDAVHLPLPSHPATSVQSAAAPAEPEARGHGGVDERLKDDTERRRSWRQSLTSLGPLTAVTTPKLLWLNSPGNPNGQVLGVAHLRKVVEWARAHDVIVASDECYAELDWREGQVGTTTPSILHSDVCGGDHTGLLAVYSLSKQSNLAGYRAAFVAGDPAIIGSVLEVRKHAGMIMPTPVQHAMAVALRDDAHVDAQRAAYGRRRERLLRGCRGRGPARRPLRGRALSLGHPRRGLLDNGFRARRPRRPGRPGVVLRRRRWPARAHRAHRHRRTHPRCVLPSDRRILTGADALRQTSAERVFQGWTLFGPRTRRWGNVARGHVRRSLAGTTGGETQ